jgi:molybdopterin-containing oxidoreductase family membrane subunit
MDRIEREARELLEARPGVLEPGHTYASVTDKISAVVLSRKTPRSWVIGFAISFVLVMGLFYTIAYLLAVGVGIWGINIPVGWGFDIINFVWWIGIGHAGTLISAILLLLRQEWRTSINRFAEAMTLFAVSCAVLYPRTGCSRIRTRWASGLSSGAPSSGTSSRSRPTASCRCSSGTWV